MDADILVVGAGLAGLTCAIKLEEAGLDVKVIERDGQVGGRVRTDKRDGFLLDRGFQVYLTAYPNAGRLLDYGQLDFRSFKSGALVWRDGEFHRFVDPTRDPFEAVATLKAPVGSLADKWGVYTMRQSLTGKSIDEIFESEEQTAEQALRERWGFSDDMINGFFRPFIGGVTLDNTLQASSRFLEFVMRMFSAGDAVVPATGMQAIPDQLASRLSEDSVLLNASVTAVADDGSVHLENGEKLTARRVVVATDGSSAHKLTGGESLDVDWVGTTCLYFSSSERPIDEPILVLNGSGNGLVNNVAVMSAVSPAYAPDGNELISVTVLERGSSDNATLEAAVRAELTEWFGQVVRDWNLLEIQHIPRSLPSQTPPALDPPARRVALSDRLFVCGDHRDTASIEGAVVSGLRTAEAITAEP